LNSAARRRGPAKTGNAALQLPFKGQLHFGMSHVVVDRKQGNLSSAIRLFVLKVYQDQIAPPEKSKSGPIGDGRRMANIDRRR
jgi:hypothetical protein